MTPPHSAPRTRLDAIKARLEAATPGPWRSDGPYVILDEGVDRESYGRRSFSLLPMTEDGEASAERADEDADLISHAPADLALLIAVATAAEGIVEQAKKFDGKAAGLGRKPSGYLLRREVVYALAAALAPLLAPVEDRP